MAPHLAVTPPNTPPRSFLFSSGYSPLHPTKGLFAFEPLPTSRWLPLTLISFLLGALLFGSASWPYRDAATEIGLTRGGPWTTPGKGLEGMEELRGSAVALGGTHGGGAVVPTANASGSGRRPVGDDYSDEDITSYPSNPSGPSLDYRRHLELTTSPPGYLSHSATLGFSRIYVLSLPHRTDRRATMSKLAAALGIQVTFVDAVPKESGVVKWIAERASEVRDLKRKLMADHLGVEDSHVGGMGVGTIWLTSSASKGGSKSNGPGLKDIAFPSLNQKAYNGKDWISYLWDPSTDHSKLQPSDPSFDVSKAMHDPLERIPERQISAATVSTFYNHLRVMREMEANGDETALVLEDDVDVEWDLERRWRGMLRRLPHNWEAVFLGHCWGKELYGASRPLRVLPCTTDGALVNRAPIPPPELAQVHGAPVHARLRDLCARSTTDPQPACGPVARVPDPNRHLPSDVHLTRPAGLLGRAPDHQPGQGRDERHSAGDRIAVEGRLG